LEEAFKYEVLTRRWRPPAIKSSQNAAAGRATRTAAAPRGPSGSWPRRCARRKFYAGVRRNSKMQQKVRNHSLEEEARRLKQRGHKYRRQETKVCRDPEKETAILIEKCKKDQASD
jgi:hypothetical protein